MSGQGQSFRGSPTSAVRTGTSDQQTKQAWAHGWREVTGGTSPGKNLQAPRKSEFPGNENRESKWAESFRKGQVKGIGGRGERVNLKKRAEDFSSFEKGGKGIIFSVLRSERM